MDLKKSQHDEKLKASEINQLTWISISGKANYLISIDLKNFIKEKIKEKKKKFVIDLENCTFMDSTFMGTLAAISNKLNEKKLKISLTLINLNKENLKSIQTLGIDRLVDIDTKAIKFPEERKIVENSLKKIKINSKNKNKLNKEMLKAHKTLSNLKEDNQIRFKNVIDYLKESAQKK